MEHYHRYLLAREFCRGKDVLDIAAGEGYGAAMLAQVAATVVGVEIDQAAVEAARIEFPRANLRFEQGDARDIPLPDGCIDVAVSFETLEHLAEQDRFLGELGRVLRPGGLLVISTPDRDVYSPTGAPPNPFHVLELTRAEFERLLGRHFAHAAVAVQRAIIGSVLLGASGAAPRTFDRRSDAVVEGSEGFSRAPYLVALASDGELPDLPDSVFVHRNDIDTDPRERRDAELAAREAERHRVAALDQAALAMADAEAARLERDAAANARADAEDRAARATQRAAALETETRRLQSILATREERAVAALHRASEIEARADALDAGLAAALQQAAAQSGRADAAEAAHAHQVAHANATESRLAAEMTGHHHANLHGLALEHRLGIIESSAYWRALNPVRWLARRHPAIGSTLRRSRKLLWWTATLQLPVRLVQHRRNRIALTRPVPTLALEALPLPEPAPNACVAPLLPASDPIRIVVSGTPRVSIVIPSYGQVEATLACLRSLADHPPACAIEVIVVDDAYPGPEDIGRLTLVEGPTILRNGANLGYLRTCNQAARAARGHYLHLLNNDTELRPGAVDALVALLDARPDAGLVGSKLLFPDGTLQEAGGILWDDASGWNYGRGQDPARPEFNHVRETDYCSGASIMLPRVLWEELGGYDEAFLPAYYEDADLGFRVRARGLKVLYEPASEVVHHEGASHGTDLSSGIKASQVKNQQVMLDRWGDVFAVSHYPPGEHVLRAANRARNRPVILVADHYAPEPDRDAGSRSIMGIIGAFLDDGWLVKFFPQNRAHTPRYAAAMERLGIEMIDYRYPGDLGDWMREHGAELDHVLVVRPDVATDVMQHLLRTTPATLSFYGVDLHFARMRRQAALDDDAGLAARADAMERLERRVWRNFDIVLYPSEEEAALVRQMAPGTNAHGIVGFCFDAGEPRRGPPPLAGKPAILFVAGFAHPPNTDAAVFLIDDVIPRVEAAVGPVRVTLAGSNPSPAVRALAGRDTDVTGYVTDEELAALYDTHRVSVVPLRFGAGVKGKVVEALSHGLPLVTTSIGAQGIPGLDGVVPVHDDAQDLAEAMARLLTDDGAWIAQSAAQVAFAGSRFSRDAMRRSVLGAYGIVR